MKVFIGKYKNWFGSYQLADLFKRIGVSEEICEKIGDWLSETWVHKFLEWIYSKRNRTVYIKIDDYDIWNLDNTLSLIILPLLRKFKASEINGHPSSFNSIAEWDEVLDKMIWSFERLNDQDDDEKFHSGNIDLIFVPDPETGNSRMEHGPNHTSTYDFEGHKKHREKIQEGLDLFGKYYTNLWD